MSTPQIILTVLSCLFIGFILLLAFNPLKKGQPFATKNYYND